MLLAVVQKIQVGSYMNGSFFNYVLLQDERFFCSHMGLDN